MQLGSSGACDWRHKGEVGAGYGNVQPASISAPNLRFGGISSKKATQLHRIAFYQPNNHHNDPAQVYRGAEIMQIQRM